MRIRLIDCDYKTVFSADRRNLTPEPDCFIYKGLTYIHLRFDIKTHTHVYKQAQMYEIDEDER